MHVLIHHDDDSHLAPPPPTRLGVPLLLPGPSSPCCPPPYPLPGLACPYSTQVPHDSAASPLQLLLLLLSCTDTGLILHQRLQCHMRWMQASNAPALGRQAGRQAVAGRMSVRMGS